MKQKDTDARALSTPEASAVEAPGAIEALTSLIGSLPPMGEEPPAPLDLSRPLWESDTRFLDPSADLPQAQAWGEMGGRPAIDRQGIITISSKPKQGKSLAVYGLLASIVSGRPLDAFRPTGEPPRLAVVFDTEMNAATLQRRIRGLYAQMGEAAAWRLAVVPLLGVKMSERRAVISDIVSRYSPDIVAIDIVTKLVPDFNSAEGCVELCDWLEKMAERRTVIAVIHQNKAREDSNMKGHLGSVLGEAAVESYKAEKKGGVFHLEAVSARNSDAEQSAPLRFVYADGAILSAADIVAQQAESEAERWRADLRAVFAGREALPFSELRARIMEQQGLGKTAAEEKIRRAKELGAIGNAGKGEPYRVLPSAAAALQGLANDEDEEV